ncbi:uncharacterized protein C9orf153 homolog isoform X3 [Vicugna pacos]|uniref:Uncharacterized protein C9orf153 homolog isoform X3 n=1 Tax=Vicugna pacos TaxID=30538 RepID=A0ABM5D314_VICPA
MLRTKTGGALLKSIQSIYSFILSVDRNLLRACTVLGLFEALGLTKCIWPWILHILFTQTLGAWLLPFRVPAYQPRAAASTKGTRSKQRSPPEPPPEIRELNPSTMLLHKDTDPSKDDVPGEPAVCSLPELYAFVENFNKESKKSHLLKTHSLLPSEAQRMLSQNVNGTEETDERGETSQPVLTCKVVRREERPGSMTELLHSSLLASSLSPLERLSRSQQRISQYGIPPPVHTFPYEILISHSKAMSQVTVRQKAHSTKLACGLGVPSDLPGKFILEDKVPKYLVDPGNLNRKTIPGPKGPGMEVLQGYCEVEAPYCRFTYKN